MKQNIKVGLFVLCGLCCMFVAVFLIGNSRQMWDTKVLYRAAFVDVSGLKIGAPIRMGGIDIGRVTALGHSTDDTDERIYVTLAVVKREQVRVRQNTVAKVGNKGLLGDKLIELVQGPGPAPPLSGGGMLPSEEMLDVGKYIRRIDSITTKVDTIMEHLEGVTRPLSDPEFSKDIKGAVAGLNHVLDGLLHRKSPLHRLLFDSAEGERVARILENLEGVSRSAAGAVKEFQSVTHQVHQGPGLMHDLLYDELLAKSMRGVVEEGHATVQSIREQSAPLLDDVRALVDGVKAGKGTLGALVTDPSLYEDLKRTVGHVERNEVLRALVRYSIRADEEVDPPSLRLLPPSSRPSLR